MRISDWSSDVCSSDLHFLPLGTTPDWEAAPDVLLTAFGLFFTTAVQIALPMIAVLFMADLGLALLTKVAPQLNAFNVMFPVKEIGRASCREGVCQYV